MKYAVEMGSGVMIYIPSFIKIGSGIHKLIRGDTQTHRQHGDLLSLLLFFQNTESRLKTGGVNLLAQATKLLTYTWRVLVSNSGRDTGYDENFGGFPYSFQANSELIP
jgi:hypothetical protein